MPRTYRRHGFAAEHAVYADGWTPPPGFRARGTWTVALSSDLPGYVDPAWLPADLRVTSIEGAGLLPQFTHPDQLVALFA